MGFSLYPALLKWLCTSLEEPDPEFYFTVYRLPVLPSYTTADTLPNKTQRHSFYGSSLQLTFCHRTECVKCLEFHSYSQLGAQQ